MTRAAPSHATIITPRLAPLLASAVLLPLLIAGCRKDAPEEVETETVVPVRTAAAVTGSIRGIVHATGLVTPAPDAELVVVAPEPARIAEIPRAEGDRVTRGDVLVRFDIPSLAAEVQRQAAEIQRAQAQLANAKAGQTRAHELFDRGVAARRDMEEADRAVADAEAAVVQAEASRAAAVATALRQVVRATFDGVIVKRFHNPGDIVEAAASDPVLRVVDPRRLEVVASVSIGDSPRIVVGAPGRIATSGAGLPDIRLRVVSRPAQVEAGTASVPVRLAFAAPGNYPVGAPLQVDIDAEQHTGVVLIPAPALVREGEETAVFVAVGDTAQRRPVRVGVQDVERVEIVSGIKAGERVLIDGQAGLPDGATITNAGGEGTENAPAGAVVEKDHGK